MLLGSGEWIKCFLGGLEGAILKCQRQKPRKEACVWAHKQGPRVCREEDIYIGRSTQQADGQENSSSSGPRALATPLLAPWAHQRNSHVAGVEVRQGPSSMGSFSPNLTITVFWAA